MRELKQLILQIDEHHFCRTFTGAWIETNLNCCNTRLNTSHLYGCVNWNRVCNFYRAIAWVAPLRVRELKHHLYLSILKNYCRTFTGAWIETEDSDQSVLDAVSHLYGCVNWNPYLSSKSNKGSKSHLYGCVNWNPANQRKVVSLMQSHLYGCVNWNHQVRLILLKSWVAPLRVRELKQTCR